MSNFFKPVLVLIISILIFIVIVWFTDTQFAGIIQTRFYNPSIINSFAEGNAKDAELVQNHIFDLQGKFSLVLNEPAVRRSFLYNQDAGDIFERSRILGILLESTVGLQAVQFVDSNGIRMHYSTSYRDIISQNTDSVSYRNYTDDPQVLPFDSVSVPAGSNAKFTMDDQNDRIVFSFPFVDSMDVYRGTALFFVSVRALAEKLIAEGRLKAGEDVSVTRSPPGILLGIPDSSKPDILEKISGIWDEGIQSRVILDAGESGVKFSLISLKTNHGIFFGRLVDDALFNISNSMKNILYLSMFLTFYLTLLFIVNFRSNPVTVVQIRIKNLRDNLFEQLYINKSSYERAKWVLELEQRRDEIHLELKHNLKITNNLEKKIDGIIDKSWDELLAVIKIGSGYIIPETDAEEKNEIKTETGETAETETEELEGIEEAEEAEELENIKAEEAEIFDDIKETETNKEIIEAEKIEVIDENTASEEIINKQKPPEAVKIKKPGKKNKVTGKTSVKKPKKTKKFIYDYSTDEYEEFKEEETAEETSQSLQTISEPDTESSTLNISNISTSEKERDFITRREFLAVASEIEFSSDFPSDVDEENESDADIKIELDIVSPFSSMFSTFDKKKKKNKL